MIAAAKLGHENSLTSVKSFFMNGLATQADYAAALRGYQNAVEELSSPDRAGRERGNRGKPNSPAIISETKLDVNNVHAH